MLRREAGRSRRAIAFRSTFDRLVFGAARSTLATARTVPFAGCARVDLSSFARGSETSALGVVLSPFLSGTSKSSRSAAIACRISNLEGRNDLRSLYTGTK